MRRSFVGEEMESIGKTVLKGAEEIKKLEKLLDDMLASEPLAALIEATSRIEVLEKELEQTLRLLSSAYSDSHNLGLKMGRIREALNGKGCGEVWLHAEKVFAVLKEANPNHPLVTYDPGY